MNTVNLESVMKMRGNFNAAQWVKRLDDAINGWIEMLLKETAHKEFRNEKLINECYDAIAVLRSAKAL